MVTLVSAGIPVGAMLPFAGLVADIPAGFLLCDGSTINRNTYSALFAAIGTAHGHGDTATTFEIPDNRGVFLRGVDHARGKDPNRTTRAAAQTGGNAGDLVGSYQSDVYASHNHLAGIHAFSGGTNYYRYGSVNQPGSYYSLNNFTFTSTNFAGFTSSAGGSETRPKNNYTNYIIKY